MNSLLFQLLASRTTRGGSPQLADMLARVSGANGGNPILDPKQLLAQLGNDNPLLTALSKHFTEARPNGSLHQTPAPENAVIDVEPEPERTEPSVLNGNAGHGEAVEIRELKEQIQNLQAEIKISRERSDLLASTVGACCLCWGHDPNCRACRGRGKPGYAIPDEALFGEFVLPAMRVLRAQKAKTNRTAESPRPQSGAESSAHIS